MAASSIYSEDEYQISADPAKYVTLPVQHEKIWRKYQTTLEWFWTVYDIYLTGDREDMSRIFDQDQRQHILKLLAFMFSTHCSTINKDLFMNLMTQVEIKEASYYFGSQADSKKTHCLMYSMLLDELLGEDKKNELISDVVCVPQVREFLMWSMSSTRQEPFARRLLSLATLQGIIFQGVFVLIKWIHQRHPDKMSGLSNSNDLIWRDEQLNLSVSCMLFGYIEDQLTEEEAHEIVKRAVFHAKKILTEALPVSILGIECCHMEQFIEHSADKILSDIHVAKLYNKESPFDWVVEPVKETRDRGYVDLSSYGQANFSTDLDF